MMKAKTQSDIVMRGDFHEKHENFMYLNNLVKIEHIPQLKFTFITQD